MLKMTGFDVLVALAGNSLYYFRARSQLTATAVGAIPINSDEKHNHQACPGPSGPQATNRCAKRTHNTLGRERVQRIFKTMGVTSIMVMALSACSETSWKEEALLHDGSKIVVSRSMDRGGRSEVGQDPPIKDQSLSFRMPVSGEKVVWEDNFTQDIGGANFLPMQLGIVSNVAYLVVKPMGCLSYNKWGRPNPPYVVFKYDAKAWQRVGLEALPLELKTPNLIPSQPDVTAKNHGAGLVPAEFIAQQYEDYRQPELKMVVRELLSKERIAEMCGDGVWYKGHWILPNDPASRALIDARQK